jgi:hypothetical protein
MLLRVLLAVITFGAAVMTRRFLASIAVVGVLAVFPDAVIAQQETPKKVAAPLANQVYVKIVVESWIAEDLKKRGQVKFMAVTEWVPLDLSPFEGTNLWYGGKVGNTHYCPVGADIPDRAKGRIKVYAIGWSPGPVDVTASLVDEPGSREIAVVERMKTDQGQPYIAVLIGPPAQRSRAAGWNGRRRRQAMRWAN